MLTFFPIPYEDEILYSILSRYQKYCGYNCIKSTIQDLYSSTKIIASVDLPSNLSALVTNMPERWNYNVEKLIYRYTLYPYFKPFWDNKRATDVLKLMKGNSVRDIHLRAGIYSNQILPWKFLRFCPECFSEDEKRYGESYWHRLHQVPGVFTCPIHKVFICDSEVRLNGENPQLYITPNKSNCHNKSKINQLNKKTIFELTELANDIEFILNSNLSAAGPAILKDKYINILRGQGYIGQKGYVNQKELTKDFIEYYGEEFLGILNLNFNMEDKHNWLSMLVRKNEYMPHPLKHLLLIKFLCGSVKDFFILDYNEKPFGDGPFPCLNVAADHYLQPVIENIKCSYSRNKNTFATFYCDCGFVYTRKGPDKDLNDRYKYSNIITYGEIWETKLRELLEKRGLHLREAAREMRVDLKTVRKLSIKLNIKTLWITDDSKEKFVKLPPYYADNKNGNNDINLYRNKWLSLIESNKGLTKTALRKIEPHLFFWLNYHDKQWFDKNIPMNTTVNHSYKKVDWVQRDTQIKNNIELIVSKILNSDKPERITIDRIGKLLGKSYLLRNHLNKLPASKSYLNLVCESIRDYQIRRIGLVVKKLLDSGEVIKVWKVKQLAGLLNADLPDIIELVNKEISKYSKGSFLAFVKH